MSTYEIVAVIRPDLDDERLGAAIERIHQRIGEHGGRVQTIDRWGKRKMAHPVGKYRDAYYVLTVFALDSRQVASLRKTLGLHEDLLRFTVATHRPSPVPAAPAAAPAGTAAPTPVAAPTSAEGAQPAASPEASGV